MGRDIAYREKLFVFFLDVMKTVIFPITGYPGPAPDSLLYLLRASGLTVTKLTHSALLVYNGNFHVGFLCYMVHRNALNAR